MGHSILVQVLQLGSKRFQAGWPIGVASAENTFDPVKHKVDIVEETPTSMD